MFAEVEGNLGEWSILGNPENPLTLQSNTSDIQFEVELNQTLSKPTIQSSNYRPLLIMVFLASVTVIGVSKQGLTDCSDYYLSIYAFGAVRANIP